MHDSAEIMEFLYSIISAKEIEKPNSAPGPPAFILLKGIKNLRSAINS